MGEYETWKAYAENLQAQRENDAATIEELQEALARVEAELKATDQKLLAKTGAHEFLKYGLNNLVKERDTAQEQLAEMRRVVAGFLFNYDDGVGKPWERRLLDYARKLVPAKEFNGQAEQQEALAYNAHTEAPYSRTGKCGDNPVPQFRFEDRAGNAEWYVRLSDYRAALATQPAAGEPEQQTAINADDLPTKKYPLGAFDFDAPVASGEQAKTSDELAAFEKWRHEQADSLRRCGYPDGAEAFIGLGSVHWAGWQARSSLATPPAAAHGDKAVQIDARLLELYQAPFRFDERGGYIWDAQNNMVADNHVDGDQAIRVRGWGRLSYRKDGEEVQDLMGQAMADALTARWEAAMRAQEEK